MILPLHSKLNFKSQMAVLSPPKPGIRKIIASSSIAESSVTIDGVVFVIDSMLQKLKYFNYYSNIDELLVVPESKTNAIQRTGRAGRTKRNLNFIKLLFLTPYSWSLLQALHEPRIRFIV